MAEMHSTAWTCLFLSGTAHAFVTPARSFDVRPSRESARAAAAEDPFAAADQRPVVLYDGVCRMCNFWVDWAISQDPSGLLRFAALQSDAGRLLLERSGRNADDISSIVVVTPQKAFIKAAAVLEIGKTLKVTTPISTVVAGIVPNVVADAAYDTIANNRYSVMGKFDTCRLRDDAHPGRFIGDAT